MAHELTREYGKGWSEQQLRHCLRTAEVFPDESKFSALRRELSWTNIKIVVYIEEELKRTFYTEYCKMEGWSSRQLQDRISSMLYERTMISRKPEEAILTELEQLEKREKSVAGHGGKLTYRTDFVYW